MKYISLYCADFPESWSVSAAMSLRDKWEKSTDEDCDMQLKALEKTGSHTLFIHLDKIILWNYNGIWSSYKTSYNWWTVILTYFIIYFNLIKVCVLKRCYWQIWMIVSVKDSMLSLPFCRPTVFSCAPVHRCALFCSLFKITLSEYVKFPFWRGHFNVKYPMFPVDVDSSTYAFMWNSIAHVTLDVNSHLKLMCLYNVTAFHLKRCSTCDEQNTVLRCSYCLLIHQ